MTEKQLKLIQYLYQRQLASPVAPSFDEMRAALGLKSKSGVHRLVLALDEQGIVEGRHYRARSIELTDKGLEIGRRAMAHVELNPTYARGFLDAQDGLPPATNQTGEYRTGYETYDEINRLLQAHNFYRQRSGVYRRVQI